jgi:hypothetical protein
VVSRETRLGFLGGYYDRHCGGQSAIALLLAEQSLCECFVGHDLDSMRFSHEAEDRETEEGAIDPISYRNWAKGVIQNERLVTSPLHADSGEEVGIDRFDIHFKKIQLRSEIRDLAARRRKKSRAAKRAISTFTPNQDTSRARSYESYVGYGCSPPNQVFGSRWSNSSTE